MALHLLVVDDSPVMREFILRVIRLSGLEVSSCFEAPNGSEAIEIMRDNRIDVVLTDMNMPVMDGEQLLVSMGQDELLRTIPVLVVSTDGSDHRVRRMMSLGAKGYVTKPFSPEVLRMNMEQLLGTAHD